MGYDDLTDWDPADDETPDVWDNATDWDAQQTAYHEAGHAIAAVLCGVAWTEIRLFDAASIESVEAGAVGRTTPLDEHYDDTTPANLAFIAWAGSYAEARYLCPDNPWRALPGIQDGGGSDMERVQTYWTDPAITPHETDEQWARNLDTAWAHVEALAQRLVRERVIRTPLHPEWEG